MATKKTTTSSKSGKRSKGAEGELKTATGDPIPAQTLDTSHQGDIPVNPAAKMDQVMQAEEAKIADQEYRESQAAKPDPPYRGDRVNHAEYMATLETHEDREKADEETRKAHQEAS